MKTSYILSTRSYRLLAITIALFMALGTSLSAKVYTWDKYNIAFEAPEGGYVPFSFFQRTSQLGRDGNDIAALYQEREHQQEEP